MTIEQGKLIATERIRQRLTQRELSTMCLRVGGTAGRSLISGIECGRRGLTEQNLRAIARVLGISEGELRGR